MTKIELILLGESGVGKTTILERFETGEFKGLNSAKPTVGQPDFHVKNLTLEGQEVSLFIWDTAGQERFRSMTRSYYKKGEGVLLVYDVTEAETYFKLTGWLREIRNENEGAEILIAGNKNEDPSKKAVAVSTVKSFAELENIEYVEMSAMSGENVEEAFVRLTRKVLIAKGIITEKPAKSSATNEYDSSSGNGLLSEVTPKKSISDKDNDIIRLEATQMVTTGVKKKSSSCC